MRLTPWRVAIGLLSLYGVSRTLARPKLSLSRQLDSSEKQHFFDAYAPVANAVSRRFRLHPAVMLAQSALETGWGRSHAGTCWALFGVKFGSQSADDARRRAAALTHLMGAPIFPARPVSLPTLEEYTPGEMTRIRDDFACYRRPIDAYAHYAYLLTHTDRYERVPLEYPDPYRQLMAIWISGYATSTQYYPAVAGLIQQFTGKPQPPELTELAAFLSRFDSRARLAYRERPW